MDKALINPSNKIQINKIRKLTLEKDDLVLTFYKLQNDLTVLELKNHKFTKSLNSNLSENQIASEMLKLNSEKSRLELEIHQINHSIETLERETKSPEKSSQNSVNS